MGLKAGPRICPTKKVIRLTHSGPRGPMIDPATDSAAPPEYNSTGHDYARRDHFTYAGPPIIDFHTHVTMTSPEDKAAGPAGGWGENGSSDSAALMLDIGAQ